MRKVYRSIEHTLPSDTTIIEDTTMPQSGEWSPKTNTIKINPEKMVSSSRNALYSTTEAGMRGYVIRHELAHKVLGHQGSYDYQQRTLNELEADLHSGSGLLEEGPDYGGLSLTMFNYIDYNKGTSGLRKLFVKAIDDVNSYRKRENMVKIPKLSLLKWFDKQAIEALASYSKERKAEGFKDRPNWRA